jgi:hypothetical protein
MRRMDQPEQSPVILAQKKPAGGKSEELVK